jgi:DNA-binding XRE family transcriptional regulator
MPEVSFQSVTNTDRLRQGQGGFDLDAKTITPTQSRMARAALDWPIEATARAAGISSRTLLRFENEQRDIKPQLISAARRVYEEAGVRFLETGPDAGAVVPPPLKVPAPR